MELSVSGAISGASARFVAMTSPLSRGDHVRVTPEVQRAASRKPSQRERAAPPRTRPVRRCPDSKNELPPIIRRAEVVAFALVALLVICVVAVLYVAKAFFLPVVTAFVVGTMLSPAAGFLERRRIPRAVSAVLIVSAVCALASSSSSA